MNFLIRHLLACTAVVLTACGESETPPGRTVTEGAPSSANAGGTLVDEAKAMTKNAIDSVEKLEWETWKNKLTPADLSKVKKVLDGIDLSAAKAKYDELAAALAKKDYVQAEFYARQFDELMSSDVAGKTIGFLRLESEKGTEAAIKAVKEYLNTPGLGASSREFGEKMLSLLQSVEQDQVEGILCIVVYYSVDSKIQVRGPHGQNVAAALAVAAVKSGFDAYDLHTKEGMELSGAIFKSMGTNEEEATKAWIEIVAASKKGAGALKDGLTSEGASEKAKQGFNALLESGKKFLDDEIKRLEEEESDAEKSGAAGGTSNKQP